MIKKATTHQLGPYQTRQEAADSPMAQEVRGVHDAGRFPDAADHLPTPAQIRSRYLKEACVAAGVELGAFDQRIVDWLAGWEDPTVQVVIGLISRAHAGQP